MVAKPFRTSNVVRDDLYQILAEGNVAKLVERYGNHGPLEQTTQPNPSTASPVVTVDANEVLTSGMLSTDDDGSRAPGNADPTAHQPGEHAHGTTLPSLHDAVAWIPPDDLWNAVRVALNQLTANQVDHQANGRTRPDFHLVDALFPIAHHLQLQQRILSYCVTFPLPATSRGSTECFVSVFVDLLVALGADLDFLYWWLLSRVAPVPVSSSCGAMEASLASFLEELEPLLPWGTSLDTTTAERYDAHLPINKAAAIQAPASDVQRVSWHMIAELAAHGAFRPSVLLRAVARHPSSIARSYHVAMWRQYLHAVKLIHSHANRRVNWAQHPSRCQDATPLGGTTLFSQECLQLIGLDDLGAMLAEPSQAPDDAGGAVWIDNGADGNAVDARSGLLVHIDDVHRTMLSELLNFNTRVGLGSGVALVANRLAIASPDDRFHINDFHLLLVFQKLGLDATVGSYILHAFVHWLAPTQKHQALLMMYDDVLRREITPLLQLLQ